MTSEDPRRKLIAEAMAVYEKTEPGLVLRAVADLVRAAVHFDDDNEGDRMRAVGVRAREQCDRLRDERRALPVAVELIEICEAANAELVDRVKYAEATIATQAAEIEELTVQAEENQRDIASMTTFNATAEATIATQAAEIERLTGGE